MAPRPKHPPPDRRREILEAAFQVFSHKGYSLATNADIARQAGVTPAALYYYFPSKEDLFRACILDRQAILKPNVEQMVEQLREMPPETVIPLLTRGVLTFLTEEPTRSLLKIILSEGIRNPEIVTMWQAHAVGPVAGVIFGYFQDQMEKGTLRRMDPRMFGILLNGSVMALILARDMLGLPIAQEIDNDTFLLELSHMQLHGFIHKREE
ncbi:MAG TPA: TetR/AcrR family transcriptional regulator [Symbiobacteriaceae bacterium]|nr:TetR/AcrR family transcriptional regulator [Symbiobacteriaceae bacterium]